MSLRHILDVLGFRAAYGPAMHLPHRTLTILIGFGLSWALCTKAEAEKEFLPPALKGKAWKLVWQDEFEGTTLDETKWNRLGDSKRRDGFWIKDDAYLSGKGTLILRTRKDGDRYTCGAVNTQGKFEHAFVRWGQPLN